MEITCVQMDVLISFYLEGELSESLKKEVEEHLKKCSVCRAKFNIINCLFEDMQENLYDKKRDYQKVNENTKHYSVFKNNLSAYIDNELSENDNIKIKKYAISNKKARKELEDTYRIRKLMKSSFDKTKNETKPDFTKNILKQLNIEESNNMLSFNPLIKVAFAFIMTVLALSSIIIFSLTM